MAFPSSYQPSQLTTSKMITHLFHKCHNSSTVSHNHSKLGTLYNSLLGSWLQVTHGLQSGRSANTQLSLKGKVSFR